MPRPLRLAAAQVGRIDRTTPRSQILAHLCSLLDQAAAQQVDLVVFPEATFTTFFPRYFLEGEELAGYFEWEANESHDESNLLKRFREYVRKVDIDVVVGYAESTSDVEALRHGTFKPSPTASDSSINLPQGYNTAIYIDGATGLTRAKYRKVHLPGTIEPFDLDPDTTNQLEKRYFRPGDLGFEAFRAPGLRRKWNESENSSPIVGMMICNDRRWAEGWRCYGLQGVEIVCIGYNTTAWAPQLWGSSADLTREEAREDAMFHHKLVVQSNAYTNATFCVTSARCGWDDGKFELITGSMIVSPEGHILAENKTDGDELIIADIDLDACRQGKSRTFCFEKHRRPEHYGRIVEWKGVREPEEVA